MLRITTDENAQVLTLRLEGRLEGPWVDVLTQCWLSAVGGPERRRLRVDLNGVTFIDNAGKAHLAAMRGQGAEFVAADCLMKAVVEEITGTLSKNKVHMTEQLTQLQRLQAELHVVNEEFTRAAQPLYRMTGLNDEQRTKIRTQLLAVQARWESVTQQISQVLGTGGAKGHVSPNYNEGGSR